MGVPAHRPAVPGLYSARQDKPWWALPPGVLFDPSWSREQKMIVHCWREARKEVSSWFSGASYRWTSLDVALRRRRV